MTKPVLVKLIIAGIVVLIVLLCVIIPVSQAYNRRRMQVELAKVLGVNINDYPYPESFPIGYLDAVLVQGMSNKEVHNYIQGYDNVYHCEGDFNFEVYNYFSQNDYSWIVLLIPYDEYKRYDGHVVTANGRTVSGKACEEGILN